MSPEQLEAYLDAVVAGAPVLTSEQIQKLRQIFGAQE